MEPLENELNNMICNDIIEGPLEVKESGTYINNLVITDKKRGPIREEQKSVSHLTAKQQTRLSIRHMNLSLPLMNCDINWLAAIVSPSST